jgi:hypothetical protein
MLGTTALRSLFARLNKDTGSMADEIGFVMDYDS